MSTDAKPQWGVFRWEPENMYLGRNAVKRYRIRAAAEKLADKMTDGPGVASFVVRSITRE